MKTQSWVVGDLKQLIGNGLHDIDVFGRSRDEKCSCPRVGNNQRLTTSTLIRGQSKCPALQQTADRISSTRKSCSTNRNYFKDSLIEIAFDIEFIDQVLHDFKTGLRGGNQQAVCSDVWKHNRGFSNRSRTSAQWARDSATKSSPV